MELNVWTSSTVINASQDAKSKNWNVTVKKPDGTQRVFHVRHIVMATGFKGGQGYVPTYPGMVGVLLNADASSNLTIAPGFVQRTNLTLPTA
jgi:hypothetical protein